LLQFAEAIVRKRGAASVNRQPPAIPQARRTLPHRSHRNPIFRIKTSDARIENQNQLLSRRTQVRPRAKHDVIPLPGPIEFPRRLEELEELPRDLPLTRCSDDPNHADRNPLSLTLLARPAWPFNGISLT